MGAGVAWCLRCRRVRHKTTAVSENTEKTRGSFGADSSTSSKSEISEDHKTQKELHSAALISIHEQNERPSQNKFSFDLLYQTLSLIPEENVLLCPLIVAACLRTMEYGATEYTLKELEQNVCSERTINDSVKYLKQAQSKEGGKIEINLANSFWTTGDVKHSFKEQVAKLGAEVFPLSVPDPINQWVDQKTSGKISDVVDQIDPNAIGILVNCVYFKGQWNSKFDKSLTKPSVFRNDDGTETLCDFMYQESDSFYYLETEHTQVVKLPYGTHGRLCATFILPPAEADRLDFSTRFLDDSWDKIQNDLVEQKGEVWLPKFKVEFSQELKSQMMQMGIQKAFDRTNARFPKISDEQVFINSLLHKTYLEIDEEGSTAAAAVKAEIVKESYIQTFSMKVERPFWMIIHDTKGNIVFLGGISDLSNSSVGAVPP